MQDLDQYRLCDPGNSVIYPGAILRGDTLMQGTLDYTLIAENRTPITISCSLTV